MIKNLYRKSTPLTSSYKSYKDETSSQLSKEWKIIKQLLIMLSDIYIITQCITQPHYVIHYKQSLLLDIRNENKEDQELYIYIYDHQRKIMCHAAAETLL